MIIPSAESLKAKITADATKRGQEVSKAKPQLDDQDSSDEDEDGQKAKRVMAAGPQRLQEEQAQPKRLSKGKAKRKKEMEDGDNDEVAAMEPGCSATFSQDLQIVINELKTIPKCFANLSPQRILNGEKLMRSVDAVCCQVVSRDAVCRILEPNVNHDIWKPEV